MMLSLAQLHKIEMNQLHKERELSDPDPEMWRWSPLDIAEFARMLEVARSLAMDGLRRLTFMEAGSGIGTKLYLARYHFGMSEYGYEINDHYLELAKDLHVNSIKWDLRESHPPWEDGDIIYMARPFKSDESNPETPDEYEVQWERAVMDRMSGGAVLISAYAAVKPNDWACYYRRPFRGVWVKPVSTPVYDAMIAREKTGSDPLVPEPSTLG
jgi:hypothetical protein